MKNFCKMTLGAIGSGEWQIGFICIGYIALELMNLATVAILIYMLVGLNDKTKGKNRGSKRVSEVLPGE